MESLWMRLGGLGLGFDSGQHLLFDFVDDIPRLVGFGIHPREVVVDVEEFSHSHATAVVAWLGHGYRQVTAFTAHICAVWASVMAIEQSRTISGLSPRLI